jgi:hypothetical protein
VSDSLQAERFRDRIRMWAKFSAPVQSGPGVNPFSCTVGSDSLRGGGGVKRRYPSPLHTSPEVEERVELFFCSLCGPSSLFLGLETDVEFRAVFVVFFHLTVCCLPFAIRFSENPSRLLLSLHLTLILRVRHTFMP